MQGNSKRNAFIFESIHTEVMEGVFRTAICKRINVFLMLNEKTVTVIGELR